MGMYARMYVLVNTYTFLEIIRTLRDILIFIHFTIIVVFYFCRLTENQSKNKAANDYEAVVLYNLGIPVRKYCQMTIM